MVSKLVKNAKNGNKKAFENLILYFHKDLYKIAQAYLILEDDVNDAIQETILLAYENITNLTNTKYFKTWLIRILINTCHAIYNKKHKENTISFEAINAEKYINGTYEIDTNIDFYTLLNKLNLEEKTILILYYIKGYKTKEIAKILSINNNTTRSKILRAKNKIKNDLKEIYNYGEKR